MGKALKAIAETLRVAKAIGKDQLRVRISKCEQDPDLKAVIAHESFRTLLDSFREPATP